MFHDKTIVTVYYIHYLRLHICLFVEHFVFGSQQKILFYALSYVLQIREKSEQKWEYKMEKRGGGSNAAQKLFVSVTVSRISINGWPMKGEKDLWRWEGTIDFFLWKCINKDIIFATPE